MQSFFKKKDPSYFVGERGVGGGGGEGGGGGRDTMIYLHIFSHF